MSRAAMQQALDAFEAGTYAAENAAITALKKALAQPEQTTPKAIKQVLTLHEGWYDVPDGQEYLGTVLERRTVYTTPQPAQQEQGLITREQHIALREAFAVGSADFYFEANPEHDSNLGRMLFERGFARGFDIHCHAIETVHNIKEQS